MTRRAVEGDDWSAVIDGQTSETIAGGSSGRGGGSDTGAGAPEASGQAPQEHPASTPFARASVHRSIGAAQTLSLETLNPQSTTLS